MKSIAVMGDIHGNLHALEAVLADAGSGYDWWCVGDILGYGPSPNECAMRVRELKARSVVGNHDLASVGSIGLDGFNPHAGKACEWTAGVLEPDVRSYVKALPETMEPAPGVLLVHGSPREPLWEYVLSVACAFESFKAFDGTICFIGHSHVPLVFSQGPDGRIEVMQPADGTELRLQERWRYLVNAGSVGQPRDGDPRAGYLTYDPSGSTLLFRRVEYDVTAVQKLMVEAGLPGFLVGRLAFGV